MPQTVYNYSWILAKLKWALNFNEGQADQNFAGPTTDPDRHYRDAINQAYKEEIEEAQIETSRAHWFRSMDITWPANQATFILPQTLVDKSVIIIRDVTDEQDGPELSIGDYADESEIWRLDSQTLQWGTDGPGQNTTMRFTYLAEAEELSQASQLPALIPARYIWLIVWSAALLLRAVAEDKSPIDWEKKRDDLREKFHKILSQGWPMRSNPPTIRNRDHDM